jgi:hypothetical protein
VEERRKAPVQQNMHFNGNIFWEVRLERLAEKLERMSRMADLKLKILLCFSRSA